MAKATIEVKIVLNRDVVIDRFISALRANDEHLVTIEEIKAAVVRAVAESVEVETLTQ